MTSDIATKLRELADEIEQPQATILPPDMSIKEAANVLAGVLKNGQLSIEVEWNGWGKRSFQINYKVIDKNTYKNIAEARSLQECVEKAVVKQQPADVLDKLDEMMPKEKAAL